MKKRILGAFAAIIAVTSLAFTLSAQDGDPKKIALTQTPGEFTNTELTLKAGEYVFEVTNQNVDHEVGFVIAKVNEDGTTGEHITTGYLANTINQGETASSGTVTLEAGTYRYFCPMNPTPEYTVTVK